MKTAVIGAGSWGTAIASLLADKGVEVRLWSYEPEVALGINNDRKNPIFLKDYSLSKNISATNNIREAVKDQDIVIMVAPSHVYRKVLESAATALKKGVIIVSATKGVENESLLLMSDVTKEVIPEETEHRFAVFSGPTFAKEIIERQPSAATVASEDEKTAKEIIDLLTTDYLRLYLNDDITGVQIGGAIKNIIAIASGIADGMGLGLNSRAALITRGSAEMMRLAIKMGADPKTLSGLAGIGDLILTATGPLSRNRTLGLRLGKGEKLDEILSSANSVAEGVKTTRSVYNLAKRHDVEMPITGAVYQVLYEDIPSAEALKKLMSRSLKQEFW